LDGSCETFFFLNNFLAVFASLAVKLFFSFADWRPWRYGCPVP
jgi:hypothetical protein